MIEPAIIAQTADAHTDADKRAWIEKQSAYGKENGVVFGRVTAHEEIPDLLLYEGWTEHPGQEQSEPRFMFAAVHE